MNLEYRDNEKWAMLRPIMDDHTEWFHRVLQALYYSEEAEPVQAADKPASFSQWLVHMNRSGESPPEIIEKLSALHSDMFKMADGLLFNLQETGKKPTYKECRRFLTVYEELVLYLRRAEKEAMLEGSGFDPLTGLRNKSVLYSDIQRELDRLERRGKPFSIALVRVNNYESMKAASAEKAEEKIKLVAELIKLSVRSFDDAYYMGDDEFILSLKQADASGGVKALERLRRELVKKNVHVRLSDGSDKPLGVSCCIAEPVTGDDVKELIKNLREDLTKNIDESADTVLKYYELSPLERFVHQDS